MMWLFAVLLVLAMGGVALLAAGRGRPMSEEYGDRPDSLVPAEGPLQGEHLRRIRFSLAFRGYRMSEVDELLDRLARELDARTSSEAPGDLAAEQPAEAPAEAQAEAPAGADVPSASTNDRPDGIPSGS